MQIPLGRGQRRMSHHFLYGYQVEAADCEAVEGVPEIVEAPYPNLRLLLGADEALAHGGAIERPAVWATEDEVVTAREVIALPQLLELSNRLIGQRAPSAAALTSCSSPYRPRSSARRSAHHP